MYKSMYIIYCIKFVYFLFKRKLFWLIFLFWYSFPREELTMHCTFIIFLFIFFRVGARTMNVYYAAHSFGFNARWFKWQWPCQVELVLGTVLSYSIGSYSHHYANKSYCCQLRLYVSWILITPLFTYLLRI